MEYASSSSSDQLEDVQSMHIKLFIQKKLFELKLSPIVSQTTNGSNSLQVTCSYGLHITVSF